MNSRELEALYWKGAKAGAATSNINYLSDALTPRPGRLGRSSLSGLAGMMLMGAASAVGRDSRRGCETGVWADDWMGLKTAYGYQYGGTQAGQEKSEYSFGGFIKETLIGEVTGGFASTAFYGAGKAIQALAGSIRSNKSSFGNLGEETFKRYMPDGKQVIDVTNLPDSGGIKISQRLTTDEMTFLTQEYGVEFAQVYKYGNGINGGGGQYYLYSGTVDSVQVPIAKDIMLINHTHPSGIDIKLLGQYQQIGSPQLSSEIIPIGKNNIRFNTNGLIGG